MIQDNSVNSCYPEIALILFGQVGNKGETGRRAGMRTPPAAHPDDTRSGAVTVDAVGLSSK